METHSQVCVVLTTRTGVSWAAAYENEGEAYRVADELLKTMQAGRNQEDVAAFHETRLVFNSAGSTQLSVPTFSVRIRDLECVAVRSFTRQVALNPYVIGLNDDDEDDDEQE